MNRENCDYEIIQGKPHLGLYFGSAITVNSLNFPFDNEEDPQYAAVKARIIMGLNEMSYSNPDLQVRHAQWIIRPPIYSGPLCQNGTIGLKWMMWGRAFKVMKFTKKGIKRYKKKLINGRRKWVRIDK